MGEQGYKDEAWAYVEALTPDSRKDLVWFRTGHGAENLFCIQLKPEGLLVMAEHDTIFLFQGGELYPLKVPMWFCKHPIKLKQCLWRLLFKYGDEMLRLNLLHAKADELVEKSFHDYERTHKFLTRKEALPLAEKWLNKPVDETEAPLSEKLH